MHLITKHTFKKLLEKYLHPDLDSSRFKKGTESVKLFMAILVFTGGIL